ncbi:hypothetical protein [Rhodococcus sp. NPDC058521]|uniref:hypothetical protein n=1 Tax=Rhodococcus sp. NPDC058521 TaxID=3346536 RepID=UPI003665A539
MDSNVVDGESADSFPFDCFSVGSSDVYVDSESSGSDVVEELRSDVSLSERSEGWESLEDGDSDSESLDDSEDDESESLGRASAAAGCIRREADPVPVRKTTARPLAASRRAALRLPMSPLREIVVRHWNRAQQ